MSEINNLDFRKYNIQSYNGQDANPTVTVSEDGSSLGLVGNGWKKIAFSYQVTANTLVEFDFKSSSQGDIQGLGFDTDNKANQNRSFHLYGTQTWGLNNYYNYQSSAGTWKHYQISVGNFFVGNMLYLTFINDHDVSRPTAESLFANLKVYEKLETKDDSLTTNEDTPITILASSLLSNDIGTSLQLIEVNNAYNGSVVLNNGTILFTPHSNFNGTAKFNYVVRDRDGKTSTSTVNLTVNPLNDLPIANNDIITTDENMPLLIPLANLLENDTDIDNDLLNIIGVDNPINGTVGRDSNGNIIFQPQTNFSGTASFDYTISDGRQGTSRSTVSVIVKRLKLNFNNHRIDSYASYQDLQSTVTILDNGATLKIVGNSWKKLAFPHTINDNTVLEFSFKSTAQGEVHAIGFDTDNVASPEYAFQLYGTQTWGNSNFKTYQTSDGNWKHYQIPVGQFFRGQMGYLTIINDHDIANPTGESIFSNIRIYETVNAVTDQVTTNEDTSLTIAVSHLLANDKLSPKFLGVENPTHGTVRLDSNGNIVFTPETHFNGTASFNYTVTDNADYIDTGIVQVLVNPINDAPIATDDTAITPFNVPITLATTTLLTNDREVDGDSFSLTAVSNAIYGNVRLNADNSILFTPEANFTGQASFQYTLTDDQGNNSQATVNVNVIKPYLGTNLNGIADYSTEIPFIDAFRSARPWITQTNGVWNTNESSLLDLDENGWIKSLPAPEDAPQYTQVSTLLYNGLNDGRYPGGKYIVLYEGEGTLKYSYNAVKDVAASRHGRDVINVTPSNSGILLSITATDPHQTGNYLRNIHVVPEAYETTYDTEIFNPTFIDRIQDFHALRFMDWMKTNNSKQGDWSNRPTLETGSWQGLGAPVEIMVELANRVNSDPWFNIPHQATDEYITNFARYVRDHLESDRKVYIEYSNEVWNSQFQQFHWVNQQAQQTPNFNGVWADWYSKRTTEITRIWDSVFGAQKDRVIGVMAAQAANPWVAQKALSYSWSNTAKTHADYGIDAIAIAPYFGPSIKREQEAEVVNWTLEPDGGLNKLFAQITQGGVLSNSTPESELAKTYKNMQRHLDLARQEGLQLIAYEGGQHLVGVGGVENNQAITDLLTQANRDPRIGEIYRQYLSQWYQMGGGLFTHFNDASRYTKFGSWGLLESIYDTSSPKYDAVTSFLYPPD